jgi:hypothetical protein
MGSPLPAPPVLPGFAIVTSAAGRLDKIRLWVAAAGLAAQPTALGGSRLRPHADALGGVRAAQGT